MSQFFFNQRASLVNDVIEGTIIASPWNKPRPSGERPGDPGGGPSRSE
ncbi:dihydroxyacetone kinase, ATP-dependent [Klebsiella pneumoniae subsp. rhinoscleromatis]|nr:dihydroxyacetone kinase, ATP-dependent [Klebsiella pneumoniae subsp. rhinoscleromatis]